MHEKQAQTTPQDPLSYPIPEVYLIPTRDPDKPGAAC